MQQVAIYCNPSAGSGRAEMVHEQVLAILAEKGIKTVQDLKSDIPVIVIGGDGTFNTLLNSLSNPEQHCFVLLPAGTSNSLCSQLSPDDDALTKLERFIAAPRYYALDMPQIHIGDKIYRFVNEASAGFAAAIAREVEQRTTKKHFNRLHLNELAYIATAFRCWGKDESYMLSLCNNRRISGDLYPCVEANAGDGVVDVYELACPRLRLPYELLRLVRAKKDKPSEYVTRRQVTEAEWLFDHPLPVEIDGNPLPPTQSLRLSLYGAQIQIF